MEFLYGKEGNKKVTSACYGTDKDDILNSTFCLEDNTNEVAQKTPYKIEKYLEVKKDSEELKKLREEGKGEVYLLDNDIVFSLDYGDEFLVVGLEVDKARIPKESYTPYEIYSIIEWIENYMGESFADYYEYLYDRKFVEWLKKNTIFNIDLIDVARYGISVPEIYGCHKTFPILNLKLDERIEDRGDLRDYLYYKINELFSKYACENPEVIKEFNDAVFIENTQDMHPDSLNINISKDRRKEYELLEKMTLESVRKDILNGLPIKFYN